MSAKTSVTLYVIFFYCCGVAILSHKILQFSGWDCFVFWGFQSEYLWLSLWISSVIT